MARRYPKPAGWNGGPDGSIMRQGSGGRLSANPNTELGERVARVDRDNDLSWDDADFGCDSAGQKTSIGGPLDQMHDDFDEYDRGLGNQSRY